MMKKIILLTKENAMDILKEYLHQNTINNQHKNITCFGTEILEGDVWWFVIYYKKYLPNSNQLNFEIVKLSEKDFVHLDKKYYYYNRDFGVTKKSWPSLIKVEDIRYFCDLKNYKKDELDDTLKEFKYLSE